MKLKKYKYFIKINNKRCGISYYIDKNGLDQGIRLQRWGNGNSEFYSVKNSRLNGVELRIKDL